MAILIYFPHSIPGGCKVEVYSLSDISPIFSQNIPQGAIYISTTLLISNNPKLKFFNFENLFLKHIVVCNLKTIIMITELENLLSDAQYEELMKAIASNKDYRLVKDGYVIEAKSTDNSLNLNIKYDTNKEVEDFKNLLNDIDDDIFVTACEQLGSETLQKIQKALNSKDINIIREATEIFKDSVRCIIMDKMDHLKCLNSLLK